MLRELLGAALICAGTLTMVARVLARSAELRRPMMNPLPRPPRRRKR